MLAPGVRVAWLWSGSRFVSLLILALNDGLWSHDALRDGAVAAFIEVRAQHVGAVDKGYTQRSCLVTDEAIDALDDL